MFKSVFMVQSERESKRQRAKERHIEMCGHKERKYMKNETGVGNSNKLGHIHTNTVTRRKDLSMDHF